MASAKNKSRQGRKLGDHEIAAILSHADKFGDKSAADQFSVSTKTVRRYRARTREGQLPEVSALVQTQKKRANERCQDLLTQTLEKTLKRLGELVPEASIRDTIGAAKILGELKITRDTLGNEQPGADSEGPGDEAPEGAAGSGADREAASVH